MDQRFKDWVRSTMKKKYFFYILFNYLAYSTLPTLIVWIKANPKVINTISACFLLIIAIIIAFIQNY